ncbi:MAG: hypothetical protein ABR591_14975 [Candidatus Velthaea sp.]
MLGSFITRSTDYALARLEFACKFPERAAPPVLDRLPDASERTLRERWDAVEAQLHAVVDYVKLVDEGARTTERSDSAFVWLKRTTRELDQYARALRWVLTVTEADASEGAPE